MFIKKAVPIVIGILLIAIQSQAGQWVYRPMKINAKKGDIVLSSKKGMVDDIIKVISGYWEHAGMIIDDGYTIRHNTRYEDDIVLDYNYIRIGFIKIKTLPKGLNPDALANGLPGIITENIDTAYNGARSRFAAANGIIVRPRPENEARFRPLLERAAEKMKGLDAFYRISAYSNMFQQDDYSSRIKGRGSMCSSAVWFANYYAGNRMNYAVFTPELTMQAAEVIYQSVRNQCADKYGILGKIFFAIQGLFGKGLDVKIANQVTNTFGYDRSADQTDYWRHHPITALTVSPDSLLLASFTNPYGKHGGAQTEGRTCYEEVEPVAITNGYYYYQE